ncbi:MAG: alpha/beta fold hydrolase [Sciscionella sp.]
MIEHFALNTPAGSFDAIGAGPGDGPGVLFLHGFPEAATEWEDQLSALGSAGYRAVAVDQRGYSPGVRPAAVADYRMESLCADVLAFADALHWPLFDLVGHDWGAAVAWRLAAVMPQRLHSLTAISVPHPAAFAVALAEDADQQRRSAYLRLFRAPGGVAEDTLLADDAAKLRAIYDGRVPSWRVQEYLHRLREPGALTAALNWYRAMTPMGDTPTVRIPTLYIFSTADDALGPAAAHATAAHVSGPYRFEVLDGVSHWVPEEAADIVSSLLLEHLGNRTPRRIDADAG